MAPYLGADNTAILGELGYGADEIARFRKRQSRAQSSSQIIGSIEGSAMEKKNPVALVTGVGPGTGAAIARRFRAADIQSRCSRENRERLTRLKDEIPNSHAYHATSPNEAQLDTTIEAIRSELGAPKVLIHNAVGGAFGNFMEIDS